MKVIVFGATGMVGQGVLRECLHDPEVEAVLSIGRSEVAESHPKLRQIARRDLLDYAPIAGELSGYDACFFCLGVSSAGMSEADYTRVTYDITLAAARALLAASPGLTFIYVSGQDTGGRAMWAQVKGRTEDALLALPFRAAYMFRPGFIEPKHGIRSRTRMYNILYMVMTPLMPLLRAAMGTSMTDTERVGRAMLVVAKRGAPKTRLENPDINALAASAA